MSGLSVPSSSMFFQWFFPVVSAQLAPFLIIFNQAKRTPRPAGRFQSPKTSGWSANSFLWRISELMTNLYKCIIMKHNLMMESVTNLDKFTSLEIPPYDFHELLLWRSYLVFHDLNLGFLATLHHSVTSSFEFEYFWGTSNGQKHRISRHDLTLFGISGTPAPFPRSWLIKMAIVFVCW